VFAECLAVRLAWGDQRRITVSGSAVEALRECDIQIHVLYFFSKQISIIL